MAVRDLPCHSVQKLLVEGGFVRYLSKLIKVISRGKGALMGQFLARIVQLPQEIISRQKAVDRIAQDGDVGAGPFNQPVNAKRHVPLDHPQPPQTRRGTIQ